MRLIPFVALVLALVLTACGGGASAPATPATATDAPAAPTTVQAAPTVADAAPTAADAAPTTASAAPTAADAAPTTASAAPTTAATAASGGDTVLTYAIVPEESQVSYAVGEVFINRNNQYNLAIGITQEISGSITLDRSAPRNSTVGPISIDISAFTSDSERRDNAIRGNWLESARFPIATFTPTQIEGLPETYTDGEELTLQITGDLLIRDVTKPVTFEVTGKIENETMSGTATTTIKMSDFGVEPPNILNVLRSEDDVKIEFKFVARPTA